MTFRLNIFNMHNAYLMLVWYINNAFILYLYWMPYICLFFRCFLIFIWHVVFQGILTLVWILNCHSLHFLISKVYSLILLLILWGIIFQFSKTHSKYLTDKLYKHERWSFKLAWHLKGAINQFRGFQINRTATQPTICSSPLSQLPLRETLFLSNYINNS